MKKCLYLVILFVSYLLAVHLNCASENNTSRDTELASSNYTQKQAYQFVVNYGDEGYTIGNQIDGLVGIMRTQGYKCEVVDGQAIHLGNDIFAVSCVVLVNDSERHNYSWEADMRNQTIKATSKLAKDLYYSQ